MTGIESGDQDRVAVPTVSLILPAHDEEAGIAVVLDTLARTLDACSVTWEIIVVDDGSRDRTFAIVAGLSLVDARIHGLRLSRNFGKEAALLAGIAAARGMAVITMDADLQHPPSVIPGLLEAWRRGAKVVHAVKRHRLRDSAMVRARASIFNRIVSWLGGIDLQNSSDFKLLDRVVVDILAHRLPERRRFFRGLADWVGYQTAEVPFDVDVRAMGKGKWSGIALIELALTALVSFTSAPLRIVTIMGVMTLLLAFGLTVDTLWSWMHGRAVSGFSTIIITLLILGSFIMISLGIIGEYIANIYEEVKARPAYLVDECVGYDNQAGLGELNRKLQAAGIKTAMAG